MDQIVALGRLLTSRADREAFARDRVEWLRQVQGPVGALAVLNQGQLEVQARGLLSKRRSAVMELLAPNKVFLRELEARGIGGFDSYAEASPWPAGHMRHVRDAVAFAGWLAQRTIRADSRMVLQLRLRIAGSEGRWRFSGIFGRWWMGGIRVFGKWWTVSLPVRWW